MDLTRDILILLGGLVFSFILLGLSSLVMMRSYTPTEASMQEDRVRRLLGELGPAAVEERLVEEVDDDEPPLRERIFRPLMEGLSRSVLRMLPSGVVRNIQEKLDSAGNPGGLTPTEFIGLRLFAVIPAIFFSIIIVMFFHSWDLGQYALFAGLFVGIAFMMLPDIMLNRVVENRRYRVRKQLPDVIDLLVVCVEAGIGFDGAVSKVVEKSRGPLPDEFARVLQEMRVGQMRAQALRSMSDRLQVPEVSSFVAAICQAEQTGGSIASTLGAQAKMMRDRRSQRIREAAAKLPVKMLFPLVFCIFPAIFVVLLGPGILQLINTFG
jgi:tight adherence protein C